MRGNIAEEAQGIRLVAPFLVLPAEHQCALGERLCLFQAARPHVFLYQWEETESLNIDSLPYHGLFHRLREQRHGVGHAPTQGIRRTQDRSHQGEIA